MHLFKKEKNITVCRGMIRRSKSQMFSYDQLFQAYQKDKFVLVSHICLKGPCYQTLAGFNTEMSYQCTTDEPYCVWLCYFLTGLPRELIANHYYNYTWSNQPIFFFFSPPVNFPQYIHAEGKIYVYNKIITNFKKINVQWISQKTGSDSDPTV